MLLRIVEADEGGAERALRRALRPVPKQPDAGLPGRFPQLLRYALPGGSAKFAAS